MNQEPVKVANSSGFPLQIGVIQAINQSRAWRVFVEEHPWRDHERGTEGFIDIVAINTYLRVGAMIIECKRVRQAAWVFLIPKEHPPDRSSASVWDSHRVDGKWIRCGWRNCQADPVSCQSLYCAIPGQEQGRRNLIERTVADLTTSVEAFAHQEINLIEQNQTANFVRIYVPVIITTAHLFVASFDPSKITLNDGELPKDASFLEVPYVRFRKAFSVLPEKPSINSIKELGEMSERTAFVVNSQRVTEFLNQFEFY